jgi:hypothetical protein
MAVSFASTLYPRATRALSQIIWVVFIAGVLASCSGNDDKIRPSEKIGKMRVNRYGHVNSAVIWDYCNNSMTAEPGIQTTDCNVPMVSELFVGLGVYGLDERQRDALWEARTWELDIDGYPVDLPAFNIADIDSGRRGTKYEARVWRIRLRNLEEGEHTLHYLMHVNQEVDGDPASQSPGTYELVVNYTVEK